MQRLQSVRHIDPSPPISPSLYKSSVVRQKILKNMFKGSSIKETMGRLISKFYHFKNMNFSAQQTNLSNCLICLNNEIIILNYDCKFATTNQLSFNYICRDEH